MANGYDYEYEFEGKIYHKLSEIAKVTGLAESTVGAHIRAKNWKLLGSEVKKRALNNRPEPKVEILKKPKIKTYKGMQYLYYGTKIRKCNRCHKEFVTEVDKRGWAIDTRCSRCKNYTDKKGYSNF